MFGFLIKKSFWDFWDNMGLLLFVNLMFFVFLSGLIGAAYIAQFSVVLAVVIMVLLLLSVIVFLGNTSAFVKEISDFRPPEFKEFFSHFKTTWLKSLKGGLFFSFLLFLSIFGMRFYSLVSGIGGMIGAIFLFWVFVVVLLSSIYYFPVMNRLDTTFLKMIKKCFLIFLDNPFQTVAVFISIIINVILFIPGPGGVLLLADNNLKLLIYKYDYLEENPEERKKIPWRALLVEDQKKVGPRTLKSTIFPWK